MPRDVGVPRERSELPPMMPLGWGWLVFMLGALFGIILAPFFWYFYFAWSAKR